MHVLVPVIDIDMPRSAPTWKIQIRAVASFKRSKEEFNQGLSCGVLPLAHTQERTSHPHSSLPVDIATLTIYQIIPMMELVVAVKEFVKSLLIVVVMMILTVNTSSSTAAAANSKPNIVIVMADDMNAQFGPYLHETHPLKGLTPVLDKFTTEGVTFSRTYTNYPVCGPCRQSFFAGRLPDTLKLYNFDKWLPQVSPSLVTIPRYFKNVHGYYTAAYGKLYHDSDRQPFGNLWNLLDQFSQPVGAFDVYGNLECATKWYCSVSKKETLTDAVIASSVVTFLKDAKNKNLSPFLLMVGFRRPHLANAVPPALVNTLSVSSDDYPDIREPLIPGVNSYRNSLARYNCDEISEKYVKFGNSEDWRPVVNTNAGRPSINMLTDDYKNRQAVLLIRKYYYAAIRVVDQRFGQILKALEKYGHAPNTIVIFTSDHGFSNGERGTWCKNALDDLVTRVPLSVRLPTSMLDANSPTRGKISNNMVQLIDIFPTLIDLVTGQFSTGTNKVVDTSGIPLDGYSFARNLLDPELITGSASYSQFPRCQERGGPQLSSCATGTVDKPCGRDVIKYMGYMVRTRKYIYVEWRKFNEVSNGCPLITWTNMPAALTKFNVRRRDLDSSSSTDWTSEPVEQELYYRDDPSMDDSPLFNVGYEVNNRAMDPTPEDARTMQALSMMIQYRHDASQKRTVCSNHGIIKLERVDGNLVERCECDAPWFGIDCAGQVTRHPTRLPTRRPASTKSPTNIPTRRPADSTKSPTKLPTPRPIESSSSPTRRPVDSSTPAPTKKPTTRKPTRSPTPEDTTIRCPSEFQKRKCTKKAFKYKKCTQSAVGMKHCVWCNKKCNPGTSKMICKDPVRFEQECGPITW